jgi:Protein of unknown function DUF262
MKIKQHNWAVSKLVSDRPSINLNPTWQRGAAWKQPRKALLIDSILRGMDIPKVYLRKLPANGVHKYDAVDGQQRIRAIWEFRAGDLSLDHPDPLPAIDGHAIHGLKFSQLHKSLRDQFDAFRVSVAEITAADNDEITNLFARLQLGVALNPAELRNAMLAPARHIIDSIATGHAFFELTKIPDTRYKRQDYVAHVFAMAAYRGQRNIKAPDLKKMILEFGPDQGPRLLALSSEVNDALTVLSEVDCQLKRRITQKWLFVDLAWLIIQQLTSGLEVNADDLAESFMEFDDLRRKYTGKPEDILQAPGSAKQSKLNKALYDYVMAFRAQGATHANLKTRNASLRAYCL